MDAAVFNSVRLEDIRGWEDMMRVSQGAFFTCSDKRIDTHVVDDRPLAKLFLTRWFTNGHRHMCFPCILIVAPCVCIPWQAVSPCLPIVNRFGVETYAWRVSVQACKSVDLK